MRLSPFQTEEVEYMVSYSPPATSSWGMPRNLSRRRVMVPLALMRLATSRSFKEPLPPLYPAMASGEWGLAEAGKAELQDALELVEDVHRELEQSGEVAFGVVVDEVADPEGIGPVAERRPAALGFVTGVGEEPGHGP